MPSDTPIDGAQRDSSLPVLVSNDGQQISVEEDIMTRCRFIAREAEGATIQNALTPMEAKSQFLYRLGSDRAEEPDPPPHI